MKYNYKNMQESIEKLKIAAEAIQSKLTSDLRHLIESGADDIWDNGIYDDHELDSINQSTLNRMDKGGTVTLEMNPDGEIQMEIDGIFISYQTMQKLISGISAEDLGILKQLSLEERKASELNSESIYNTLLEHGPQNDSEFEARQGHTRAWYSERMAETRERISALDHAIQSVNGAQSNKTA